MEPVSRGEEVSLANACNIVQMQLASARLNLESCAQHGCGFWELGQLELFCYEFQRLNIQFRVPLLGSVTEPDCHVEVVH